MRQLRLRVYIFHLIIVSCLDILIHLQFPIFSDKQTVTVGFAVKDTPRQTITIFPPFEFGLEAAEKSILVSVDFHIFPNSIGNIVNIFLHNVTEQMLMHDWNSILMLRGIIAHWNQTDEPTDGRTERSGDRAIDRHPDIGKLFFRLSSEIMVLMFICCE